MQQLSRHQQGITFTGIFFILVALGCFVIFALRIFPLYNEYLIVKGVMESIATESSAKNKTTRDIRRRFLKNAEVNNRDRFNDASIKEMVIVTNSKDKKKRFLNVKYRAENKLFKNVYLMMDVDETLELGVTPQ